MYVCVCFCHSITICLCLCGGFHEKNQEHCVREILFCVLSSFASYAPISLLPFPWHDAVPSW